MTSRQNQSSHTPGRVREMQKPESAMRSGAAQVLADKKLVDASRSATFAGVYTVLRGVRVVRVAPDIDKMSQPTSARSQTQRAENERLSKRLGIKAPRNALRLRTACERHSSGVLA